MGHANVAVFVPHAGCPCACSFCNQRSISGHRRPPDAAAVRAVCEEAARSLSPSAQAQFAFFGGSFTALDRAYLIELLEAVFPYVKKKVFTGIRISTRPDAIDAARLALLERYGVRAIELGAQSMDDAVLAQNRRGHTATDTAQAAKMIRAAGFELGLQMMTGLYGADDRSDLASARALAALNPETMRIYPTLVLQDTPLEALYRAGNYRPQTLEAAVLIGAKLLDLFMERQIRVIRMGLHAARSLEAGLIAGPYHPAFRELCEGRLLCERVAAVLQNKTGERFRLHLSPKSISKITGHGASGVAYLRGLGYNIKIQADHSLSGLDFSIEEV